LAVVISGPSGAGKSTVVQRLVERHGYEVSVSATTRPPRPGEKDGVAYHFWDRERFRRAIEAGELLEYAVVYNDYKGIPKQQIRDALASGRDVILRVDVQGAATVRRLVPNAISVFLTTHSERGLVSRLRQRKQDTAEGMALRTATARQEMRRVQEFDYCVVNPEGHPEVAVNHVLSIIDAAHCRITQRPVEL